MATIFPRHSPCHLFGHPTRRIKLRQSSRGSVCVSIYRKARARGLLWLIALAIAGAFLIRDSSRALRAADGENVAWGATDPAWSPDGARLAFSLFGSIWQVPVQGGVAEQISAGPGYHAHPAWSPHGDKIAFISGGPPSGAKANVTGKLMLVDAATGRAQEHVTPYPVAGTLAWSPDAARIV